MDLDVICEDKINPNYFIFFQDYAVMVKENLEAQEYSFEPLL